MHAKAFKNPEEIVFQPEPIVLFTYKYVSHIKKIFSYRGLGIHVNINTCFTYKPINTCTASHRGSGIWVKITTITYLFMCMCKTKHIKGSFLHLSKVSSTLFGKNWLKKNLVLERTRSLHTIFPSSISLVTGQVPRPSQANTSRVVF